MYQKIVQVSDFIADTEISNFSEKLLRKNLSNNGVDTVLLDQLKIRCYHCNLPKHRARDSLKV